MLLLWPRYKRTAASNSFPLRWFAGKEPLGQDHLATCILMRHCLLPGRVAARQSKRDTYLETRQAAYGQSGWRCQNACGCTMMLSSLLSSPDAFETKRVRSNCSSGYRRGHAPGAVARLLTIFGQNSMCETRSGVRAAHPCSSKPCPGDTSPKWTHLSAGNRLSKHKQSP